MKPIALVSILILLAAAGLTLADQEISASSKATKKLKEIEALPSGILVAHTPSPVRYTLHTPTVSGIKWEFSTTVSSQAGPVTIVEYGYFVERNGQWEVPYRDDEVPGTYTSNDFAEKYNSPKSKLLPGEAYTDTHSRSVIDCVPEQMVKWYFIGLDAEGNRVKGEADLKLVSELDPTEHGPHK